ncbi:hypothetical protein SAV14893_086560 [Streptomyces avermitilis]|uniref:Uncharacterized protein n=1 Tax=Streptomyces avermitilis TaxID=33903 RepID=A0A4D4MBL0_STRAX|nr:hypothetical protein SAV14893_086560 [Streptomyces avermitilis]
MSRALDTAGTLAPEHPAVLPGAARAASPPASAAPCSSRTPTRTTTPTSRSRSSSTKQGSTPTNCPTARTELPTLFRKLARDDDIDNGRFAHHPFQETTEIQTQRITELPAPTSDQLIS